jgi:hypothetical protein
MQKDWAPIKEDGVPMQGQIESSMEAAHCLNMKENKIPFKLKNNGTFFSDIF